MYSTAFGKQGFKLQWSKAEVRLYVACSETKHHSAAKVQYSFKLNAIPIVLLTCLLCATCTKRFASQWRPRAPTQFSTDVTKSTLMAGYYLFGSSAARYNIRRNPSILLHKISMKPSPNPFSTPQTKEKWPVWPRENTCTTTGSTHSTNTNNITYLHCDSKEWILKNKLEHRQYKKFCVIMPTSNNVITLPESCYQHRSIRSHKTYNTHAVLKKGLACRLRPIMPA